MRFISKFNEHRISYFNHDIKKLVPKKLDIITHNGNWSLKLSDLTINSDLIQFNYWQKTFSKPNEVLNDGEPDYLEFDIYFSKNDNSFKMLIDITYGDAMIVEFSIESPNIINIINYEGLGSKYSPDTFFGFTDESLDNLLKFFNCFTHLDLSKKDFAFIDKYPNSYKHDVNNKDHYYTDDSKLNKFNNVFNK